MYFDWNSRDGIIEMESGGLQFNLLMISEEFGLTTTQMGNLVSIQYLAFILIPLIFGGFGDKYGKRLLFSYLHYASQQGAWHSCYQVDSY